MRRCRGLTLIELLVVLAIVGTLLTVAAPKYFATLERAKEATLKTNLRALREVIDKYHADKGSYPPDLNALATERYLREVPQDPVTESAQTWVLVSPPDASASGVQDVRSGAPGKGRDGTEYASW